jgi:maleate isomerase
MAKAGSMKRIGLIIPSSNRMVEQEMVRVLPAGSTAHVARLRMTGAYEKPIDDLLPAVASAADMLRDARCDAVAFHCTANSTSEGELGEKRLLAALRGSSANPVTTTATAIRDALHALSARRIVLVTPYSQAVTEHEAQFFEDAGYAVAAIAALDCGGSDAYCAVAPEVWESTLSDVRRDDVDAYVLSCANIACFGIIERSERSLQKPIVTSNQSVLWATLRAAMAPRPDGLGQLMRIT